MEIELFHDEMNVNHSLGDVRSVGTLAVCDLGGSFFFSPVIVNYSRMFIVDGIVDPFQAGWSFGSAEASKSHAIVD